MVVQLLLSLSILVGVHEFGHLIAAKAFGMKVEKFSIGFPPKIWGIKIGETEYGIGAIPLGGFVKITGMIDESLDTKSLSKEPEPYEFRAKPAWQRLIVMLGGIIVNVIIGITIFTLALLVYGETYISRDEAIKNGIIAGTYAEELGFQDGDKILLLNGQQYQEFRDTYGPEVLLTDTDVVYTVERGGKELTLTITPDQAGALANDENKNQFIDLKSPFAFTGNFEKWSNAGEIQANDEILFVDSVAVRFFDEFQAALSQRANRMVDLTVLRGEQTVTLRNIQVNEDGLIGAGVINKTEFSRTDYSFGEAIKTGPAKAFSAVTLNIRAFGKIFSGKMRARDSVAGPIGIASFFGTEWIWERFWSITGLLSMVLAFMNLLPIPALDGGHVVFLLYEMISGRKPSDKFLETAQKIGMILLLALIVLILFNDTLKAIF